MYSKFSTMKHVYFGDYVKETPILDLGFMSADERIANILTAGMVLQEARADQYGYQNVESADDMDIADNDMSAIVYCDKMEAHDFAETLERKKLDQIANATRSFSVDASNKISVETHSEAVDNVPDSSRE